MQLALTRPDNHAASVLAVTVQEKSKKSYFDANGLTGSRAARRRTAVGRRKTETAAATAGIGRSWTLHG